MTSSKQTKIETKIEPGYETSTFALGVGIAMAAFVGIWGTACLASAMISMGPMNVVKGYISALVG